METDGPDYCSIHPCRAATMLPSASLLVGGAELGLGISNVLQIPWKVGLVATDGVGEALPSGGAWPCGGQVHTCMCAFCVLATSPEGTSQDVNPPPTCTLHLLRLVKPIVGPRVQRWRGEEPQIS